MCGKMCHVIKSNQNYNNTEIESVKKRPGKKMQNKIRVGTKRSYWWSRPSRAQQRCWNWGRSHVDCVRLGVVFFSRRVIFGVKTRSLWTCQSINQHRDRASDEINHFNTNNARAVLTSYTQQPWAMSRTVNALSNFIITNMCILCMRWILASSYPQRSTWC